MKPIYLLIENQTVGPMDVWEIRDRLKRQEINSATLWAEEGGEEWKPVFELPAFAPHRKAPERAQSNGMSGWVWVGIFVAMAFAGLAAAAGGGSGLVLFFLASIAGAVFYFIPAAIAMKGAHPQAFAIVVLNLVAGWTFLGWVIALVWACTVPKR